MLTGIYFKGSTCSPYSLIFIIALFLLSSCQQKSHTSNPTKFPDVRRDSNESQSSIGSASKTRVVAVTPVSEAPITPIQSPDLEPSASPSIGAETSATSVPGFQLADSRDYMYLPSNSLFWHPSLQHVIQPDRQTRYSIWPWSPNGERLVYKLVDQDMLAIYELQSGSVALVSGITTNAEPPVWSRDGKYLVYSTRDANTNLTTIQVYELATEQVIFSTQPIVLHRIIGWSSDSTNIGYIRRESLVEGIVSTLVLDILDPFTGQQREYESPAGNLWESGAWSPNSNQMLLFGIDPSLGIPEPGILTYAHLSIQLLDLDSGTIEEIIRDSTHTNAGYQNDDLPGLYVNHMPWSIDGKRFYYSDRGLICYIQIADKVGTCLDEVNAAIKQAGAIGGEYPSVSPTGDWLGFILSYPDQYGGPIAVIRLDGSELRFTDVALGESSLFGPIWSPKH